MSIDYQRRAPKRKPVPDVEPRTEPIPTQPLPVVRPQPVPVPVPVPPSAPSGRVTRRAGERRPGPKPAPKPRPCPTPEPARKRVGDLPAMWAGRTLVAALGVAAVTHGAEGLGWLLLALAVFSWWRMRQPIRYCLAWAGLVVLRAYVVRKLAPYREQLGDLGSARDPDAQWMQILQSRCRTCGG